MFFPMLQWVFVFASLELLRLLSFAHAFPPRDADPEEMDAVQAARSDAAAHSAAWGSFY